MESRDSEVKNCRIEFSGGWAALCQDYEEPPSENMIREYAESFDSLVEYCRDAAAIPGAATARHSDRCRSKYCAVSGTEHALYVLAAQRVLIRAQLPNSGSLATASAKGVP